MADVSQSPIGSVPHGSTTKELGSRMFLSLDEKLSVRDFDLNVSCPVCQRDDGLLQIGDSMFCASCGYASEGAGGCT